MAQDRKKVLVLWCWLCRFTNCNQIAKSDINRRRNTLINKNEYHYEATWLHEASAGKL